MVLGLDVRPRVREQADALEVEEDGPALRNRHERELAKREEAGLSGQGEERPAVALVDDERAAGMMVDDREMGDRAPQHLVTALGGAQQPELVRRDAQIVLLLTPPFDQMPHDPGYIKGYVPGVRENGGQYTHAAIWVVFALARLGRGSAAMELFHMLNPINHSRTQADAQRYRTEPYVLDGDVYARPPHAGRGGWSWYTGSAGWLYRAGLESILGLKQHGNTFAVEPCIPSSWDRYSIVWKIGETTYEIEVKNPRRVWTGVLTAELDGKSVSHDAIPIVTDGKKHVVSVTMGQRW